MLKYLSFMIISCFSSYMVYLAKDPNIIVNKIENNEIKEDIEIEKELMVIEIPKLNIKEKIYNKNSKLNNIDKNIIIMNESNMPDEEYGIVIIGGHSGFGKYAFFKDLNKLSFNDEINIYYLGNKYTYKVINFYLDKKDGTISISNFNKKNKLFLYTCNPNDKNNYLVYDCERV